MFSQGLLQARLHLKDCYGEVVCLAQQELHQMAMGGGELLLSQPTASTTTKKVADWYQSPLLSQYIVDPVTAGGVHVHQGLTCTQHLPPAAY